MLPVSISLPISAKLRGQPRRPAVEPFTHFLTGAVLARTGFNRTTALATTTMVLAAEAPDIDVLARIWGPVAGFAHHRGITHTLVGAPLVSGLVVGVVFAGHKLRRHFKKHRAGESEAQEPGAGPNAARDQTLNAAPRWGLLFLYGILAVLVHILLDFTNNYGVRPFLPFHNRWYSWDIVFIVEPLLYVALLGGLLLPWLFGLVHEEIGVRKRRGQGKVGAFAAIVAILLIWGVRDFEHRRALAVLEGRLYQGQVPIRVSAYPYYINPFKWYGVVETKTSYEQVIVDSLTPEVDPQGEARTRYKTADTEVTIAAKRSYLGRVYLDWAQYPVLEAQKLPPGDQYWVRFLDLRFQYPERWGRAALSANELLNNKLQVTDAWFGGGLFGSEGPVPGAGTSGAP